MAEKFYLRWDNHQSSMVTAFKTFLESNTLVDCVLSAEGKTIKAHKLMLSAASPYFKDLLSQECHNILTLQDVDFGSLQHIIQFIYYGEVNITHHELANLFSAAEKLQVIGLSGHGTGIPKQQVSELPDREDSTSSSRPNRKRLQRRSIDEPNNGESESFMPADSELDVTIVTTEVDLIQIDGRFQPVQTGVSYDCPMCAKKFGSRYALKRHQRDAHDADPSTSVQCSECNKLYKNLNSLSTHKILYHGVRKHKHSKYQ